MVMLDWITSLRLAYKRIPEMIDFIEALPSNISLRDLEKVV